MKPQETFCAGEGLDLGTVPDDFGLDRQMHDQQRIRRWSYEFDPAGLGLLRRAIEHVAAERPASAEDTDVKKPAPRRKRGTTQKASAAAERSVVMGVPISKPDKPL